MILSNCAACGKIYMKVSKPVCPDCARKELDTVKQIRDYLKPKERRNSPIIQISRDLDIPVIYIEYLVREKYFDVTRYPSMMYACKNCGAPISTGEYCSNCLGELQKEIQKAQDGLKKSAADGKSGDADDPFYRSRL